MILLILTQKIGGKNDGTRTEDDLGSFFPHLGDNGLSGINDTSKSVQSFEQDAIDWS